MTVTVEPGGGPATEAAEPAPKRATRIVPPPAEALPREPGRLHLYVAPDEPASHRAMLARAVLGLETAIPAIPATPPPEGGPRRFARPEPVFGADGPEALHAAATPGRDGAVALPLLVDAETRRAVANRDDDVLRLFDGWSEVGRRLRPQGLEAEIDAWVRLILRDVEGAAERAGAALHQAVYETEALALFATLERLEARLVQSRWLCGETFTEADLTLFPALARFDAGYYTGHGCNLRRLTDHPNLWAYARDVHAMPGVAETVDFALYRRVCNASAAGHRRGLTPIGPEPADWSAPHGRG